MPDLFPVDTPEISASYEISRARSVACSMVDANLSTLDRQMEKRRSGVPPCGQATRDRAEPGVRFEPRCLLRAAEAALAASSATACSVRYRRDVGAFPDRAFP
jgi:hypothetical protein